MSSVQNQSVCKGSFQEIANLGKAIFRKQFPHRVIRCASEAQREI
jgi:hypothetical protein